MGTVQHQIDGCASTMADQDPRLVDQACALIPRRALVGAVDPRGAGPRLARLQHDAAIDRQPDEVRQAALGVGVAGDLEATSHARLPRRSRFDTISGSPAKV
jgi:hypothetical protein